MISVTSTFTGKAKKFQISRALQTIQSKVICIVQKEFHQTSQDIHLIKENFIKADYLLRFINRVINDHKGKDHGDEDLIIPPDFTKPLISIKIPYCELPHCLSVSLSVCLPVSLSVCLTVSQSVCNFFKKLPFSFF